MDLLACDGLTYLPAPKAEALEAKHRTQSKPQRSSMDDIAIESIRLRKNETGSAVLLVDLVQQVIECC